MGRVQRLAKQFQPTPPVWGATAPSMAAFRSSSISTHAPRVGGDISADEAGKDSQ